MFFALLVPLGWGITNIIDKIVVEKYFKSPELATVFLQFVGLAWVLLASLFFEVEPIDFDTLLLFSFSIVLWLGGILFYFRALLSGETSRVITAFNILPLFVMFLAIAFIGETITEPQIVGVILLVAGAALVSFKKGKESFFRGWIVLVLISALLFSADTIMTSIVVTRLGWFSALYWKMVIACAIVLLLSPLYARKLFSVVKKHPKGAILGGLGEGISMTARGILYFSFTLAPVSLVYSVSSVQPFLVLVIAVIMTKFAPRYLKENIAADQISIKLIAVLLAVAGAILIS